MSILFKPQAPSLKFAKHVHGTGVIHQFCIYPDAQLKKKKQKTITDCLVLSSVLQVYFFVIITNTFRKSFIAVVLIFVVWRHIQHS